MAPRIPPPDNAKDLVLRIQPVSAMISLRKAPNVKAEDRAIADEQAGNGADHHPPGIGEFQPP
jgi:hypothetical protein